MSMFCPEHFYGKFQAYRKVERIILGTPKESQTRFFYIWHFVEVALSRVYPFNHHQVILLFNAFQSCRHGPSHSWIYPHTSLTRIQGLSRFFFFFELTFICSEIDLKSRIRWVLNVSSFQFLVTSWITSSLIYSPQPAHASPGSKKSRSL